MYIKDIEREDDGHSSWGANQKDASDYPTGRCLLSIPFVLDIDTESIIRSFYLYREIENPHSPSRYVAPVRKKKRSPSFFPSTSLDRSWIDPSDSYHHYPPPSSLSWFMWMELMDRKKERGVTLLDGVRHVRIRMVLGLCFILALRLGRWLQLSKKMVTLSSIKSQWRRRRRRRCRCSMTLYRYSAAEDK